MMTQAITIYSYHRVETEAISDIIIQRTAINSESVASGKILHWRHKTELTAQSTIFPNYLNYEQEVFKSKARGTAFHHYI